MSDTLKQEDPDWLYKHSSPPPWSINNETTSEASPSVVLGGEPIHNDASRRGRAKDFWHTIQISTSWLKNRALKNRANARLVSVAPEWIPAYEEFREYLMNGVQEDLCNLEGFDCSSVNVLLQAFDSVFGELVDKAKGNSN